MENAKLFNESNSLSKTNSLLTLQEYAMRIKWKPNINNVIDIGSGDGSLTSMLKMYIPTQFTILGTDVSEKMVDFANYNYGNERTSFMLLDIGDILPNSLKQNFDFVFSSFTLHWVKDQERAFRNIYNLLNEGGDCLLVFLPDNIFVCEVYYKLARNKKWAPWFQDIERYISPYFRCEEPHKIIKNMMKKIGFVDIEVKCKHNKFIYESFYHMKSLLQAICPFKIPEQLVEDFMQDYFDILTEMGIVDKVNNKYVLTKPFDYRLVTVYGSKRTKTMWQNKAM